ncbi:MAG: tetratricopeptide repeat protein [Pirellulales bacterium]
MRARRLSILFVVALIASAVMPTLRADRPTSDSANSDFTAAAQAYADADWHEAGERFRAFLTTHPDDERTTRARFYLGESLVQCGQFDEAVRTFEDLYQRGAPSEQAVLSEQDVPPAWGLDAELQAKMTYRLGEAYYLAGRTVEAASHLEEFCRRWPDDTMAEYALLYLGEMGAGRRRRRVGPAVARPAVATFSRGTTAV